MTHLANFYAERAELAYTVEHLPMSHAGLYVLELARYDALKADIASLEEAFAQSWQRPQTGEVPVLPWCSVCGRKDRVLLPGRMLCVVCEGIVAAGTITPGEHAEAERTA